jgi:hypothetical protein
VLSLDHLLEQDAAGVLGDVHVKLDVTAVHSEAEFRVVAANREPTEQHVDFLGEGLELLTLSGVARSANKRAA